MCVGGKGEGRGTRARAHTLTHARTLAGFRTRNILCAPIQDADGRTVGVLQALNHEGGPFTHEEEEMMGMISAQVCVCACVCAPFRPP